MNAEILVSEASFYEILNTNVCYIPQKLAEIAIDVYYQTVVEMVRKNKKLWNLFSRADIVSIGGLGHAG